MISGAGWIYFNNNKLKPEKYKSNLGMSSCLRMSSWALSIWTYLLWPIFFPGYLWLRYRIINNHLTIREKYKEQ